jgi:hypothetical protein
MRQKAIGLLAVIAALLVACASLPAPETFNERLAAGYSSVTAARTTATTLLEQKRITGQDAMNVQAQADIARQALDIARATHRIDAVAGDAKLTAAVTTLTALQAYLNARSQ